MGARDPASHLLLQTHFRLVGKAIQDGKACARDASSRTEMLGGTKQF
jgi:hypothetical protein